MESVSKPGLFPLLGCLSLHWFQIEIVIQMEIVEVLPVYEEIEHVVHLPAHLQPSLHPVKCSRLEELGGFE